LLLAIEPRMPCVRSAALAAADVEHAEAIVYTVNVTATGVFPETVTRGSEKQPFVRTGLLETVQATVPL